MSAALPAFDRAAVEAELERIAGWWSRTLVDERDGGFLGEIDANGVAVPDANKGIVLNSRLLWFFSAMAAHGNRGDCRTLAVRAFDYLVRYFDDPDHGGAVWDLAHDGSVRNDKKQVYALCFCIYAFAEYFSASGDAAALDLARDYAELIESHAADPQYGGYFEAYARDWSPIDDYRLGRGDLNAPKTMNTHLHLLEAYTALHRVAPGEVTRQRLRKVIDLLCECIYEPNRGHLRLYFDIAWNNQASVVSYGHDIEASWLLWEAAESLDDETVRARVRPVTLKLAAKCLAEGIGPDGQVCNEFNVVAGRRSEEAIWWIQAEALVGFLNACELSGESQYRQACDRVWRFIAERQIDREGGDWHWLAAGTCDPAERPYKAGFWKGPYHNGRAMLECSRRLGRLDNAAC